MTTQSEAWIPSDTFGRRLLDLRYEKNLTVEQAARAAQISPATWSTWERGAHPQNMAKVVAKIVLAHGCNRDWLMWGAGEPTTGRKSADKRPLSSAA